MVDFTQQLLVLKASLSAGLAYMISFGKLHSDRLIALVHLQRPQRVILQGNKYSIYKFGTLDSDVLTCFEDLARCNSSRLHL